MRTVIYARFSSDKQNPYSSADQVAMCRDRADREGWPVVAVFEDDAVSGRAGVKPHQRPGMAALLDFVANGGADQVLAESTDRISRHAGDSQFIRECVEFAGGRLFTLFQGTITPMVGLISAFKDAEFLSDLGNRARRGHIANVKRGRASGGAAYGHKIANTVDERGRLVAGLREIDPEEAEIVRRIFREYLSGKSPMKIARDLNAEGVKAPRGPIWQSGTILGHRKTGFGILRNRVYLGKMVYGRSKQALNPVTRRKLMRPTNEPEAIVEGDAPHLRIIDDETWQLVQEDRGGRRLSG